MAIPSSRVLEPGESLLSCDPQPALNFSAVSAPMSSKRFSVASQLWEPCLHCISLKHGVVATYVSDSLPAHILLDIRSLPVAAHRFCSRGHLLSDRGTCRAFYLSSYGHGPQSTHGPTTSRRRYLDCICSPSCVLILYVLGTHTMVNFLQFCSTLGDIY